MPDNNRLQLLNTAQEAFNSDPLRSFHNGHTGDSYEELFYVRNQNPSKFYTGVKVAPAWKGQYDGKGEFGNTGWGVKLMFGKRRPTEQEWDLVDSGSTIQIPDIGTKEAADTFTNHPIWVRIFCPGNEPAQIKDNMELRISYSVKEVGS